MNVRLTVFVVFSEEASDSADVSEGNQILGSFTCNFITWL